MGILRKRLGEVLEHADKKATARRGIRSWTEQADITL
jgi:hypothetical protein